MYGAKLWGVLCTLPLLLTACTVTTPDDSVWEDVSNFSWPTEIGTVMKYRKIVGDTIKTEVVVIEQGKAGPGQDQLADYLMLKDTTLVTPPRVYFRANRDTLRAIKDDIGMDMELVAPLEKGHTWYTESTTLGVTWKAEIIDRYAYRKIEGTVYPNVIAVKYRRYDANGTPDSEEWIRFFAEDVGEILSIRNLYPVSSSPAQILPQQMERRELIGITGTLD